MSKHKLIEFEWLITNGVPARDKSITGRLEKGWKIVAVVPAILIHPSSTEYDMATIFSRYTPYPKDENAIPDTAN
jgi:hypothetical protein